MVQAIRSFEEGCRRGLGIVVRCECGKTCTFRCSDFEGYIAPSADIEELTWRCLWCRATATYVRYTSIERMDRQDIAQWTPPKGRRRRWPSEDEVRRIR